MMLVRVVFFEETKLRRFHHIHEIRVRVVLLLCVVISIPDDAFFASSKMSHSQQNSLLLDVMILAQSMTLSYFGLDAQAKSASLLPLFVLELKLCIENNLSLIHI